MALIKCSECGHMISSTAIACPKCGAPTSRYVVCPDCGEYVPRDAAECPECGCPLKEDEPQTAMPAPPPAASPAATASAPQQHESESKTTAGANVTEESRQPAAQVAEPQYAEEQGEYYEEIVDEPKKSAKRKILIISLIVVLVLGGAAGAWYFLKGTGSETTESELLGDDDSEATEANPNAYVSLGGVVAQQWLVGSFNATYSTAEGASRNVTMAIDSLGTVKLDIETDGQQNASAGVLVLQYADSISVSFTDGYYKGLETSFRIDTTGHRICPEGNAWLIKLEQ